MTTLMVWGYAFNALDEMERQKIPLVAMGTVGISESFNPRKTHPDFDFEWVGCRKSEPLAPMPEEVFVCLKRIKAVTFDFLPYDNNFFVMSEAFLSFLTSHGLTSVFATSRAHIVDTKGRPLTDQPYVLARFVPWEVEEFAPVPNLDTQQQDSRSGIFLTDNRDYAQAFLVTDDLAEEITSRFSTPFLYSLEEWKSANDSNSFWL